MKKRLLVLLLIIICFGMTITSNMVVGANASSAASMIVLETSTNRILCEHNAYSKRYNASTTKIITAITVLEHCDNVEQYITVGKESVGVEGSSIYLELGEKIKIIDLLYGLMLQSGNDAATALAVHIGGSVEGFATLMNDIATKVGAKSSHFVNPHGLHNDNHYTTAYDLGLISTYALQNPVFKQIVATKVHRFDRPQKGYLYSLSNKNKILTTLEGGDGVKTGFTKRAGRCLVSSATRGGMQVVCVVLNCGPMFEESRYLIDKALDDYTLTEIIPSYTYVGNASVKGGRESEVKAYSKIPFVYPIRESESAAIVKIIEFDELHAPIKRNAQIGNIKIYLHNRLLFSQKLYSIDSVQSQRIVDMLRDLLNEWF